MVYNGYYKVMSNIPKMGHLTTPAYNQCWIHGGNCSIVELCCFFWRFWHDGDHLTIYPTDDSIPREVKVESLLAYWFWNLFGYLVGGLEHEFCFSIIYIYIYTYIYILCVNVIIPNDELHHFWEGLVETTNHLMFPLKPLFWCGFPIATFDSFPLTNIVQCG